MAGLDGGYMSYQLCCSKVDKTKQSSSAAAMVQFSDDDDDGSWYSVLNVLVLVRVFVDGEDAGYCGGVLLRGAVTLLTSVVKPQHKPLHPSL
jgi:hypothetical protein